MTLPRRTNPERHGVADHRESDAPGSGTERVPSYSRYPSTRRELFNSGYEFMTVKRCPCGELMELWDAPDASTVAFNPMRMMDAPVQNHFLTCRMAGQFRRAIPSGAPPTTQSPGRTPPAAPAAPPAADLHSAPRSTTQSGAIDPPETTEPPNAQP